MWLHCGYLGGKPADERQSAQQRLAFASALATAPSALSGRPAAPFALIAVEIRTNLPTICNSLPQQQIGVAARPPPAVDCFGAPTAGPTTPTAIAHCRRR